MSAQKQVKPAKRGNCYLVKVTILTFFFSIFLPNCLTLGIRGAGTSLDCLH